jgi:hypothetical protein
LIFGQDFDFAYLEKILVEAIRKIKALQIRAAEEPLIKRTISRYSIFQSACLDFFANFIWPKIINNPVISAVYQAPFCGHPIDYFRFIGDHQAAWLTRC